MVCVPDGSSFRPIVLLLYAPQGWTSSPLLQGEGGEFASLSPYIDMQAVYSLPIAKKVKNQTRISSKHQVTIPIGPFRMAGFGPGDTLAVEADGAGRVVLTRVDELVDRFSGCVDTGGDLREQLAALRDEWR